MKKYRDEKSLKEDFKYLKTILQMRTRPNTYQKNYDSFIDTDYLHGSFGTKQNIVLGVSELHHDSLKKIKAYGFTKYHQKLFKETDYLFLDENSKVKQAIVVAQSYLTKDNINFYFWGHSLDVSDREYIEEIFSFNNTKDSRVRVTVYYFNNTTKFSLLNNLLTILGKEKVEKWMKNKWLQFKPNPEIKFNEMISEKTA
nr:AbiH family protein [Acinetobacter sp. YH01022]